MSDRRTAAPTFADLGLDPALVRVLGRRGITEPFPIQAATLPGSLAGRDILGRGRTGSGKTVAFALPVVSRLLASGSPRRPGRPRALVLVPTRELAVQVADTVEYLAHAVGLRTMTVYGGVRYTGQLHRLERGVDVVIATPGRLEDLVEQGVCDLGGVEVTVLDEADLMADMGFLPAVIRILDQVPADGQRMLFSATLDGEVQTLVTAYLHDPEEHAVDADRATPDTRHHLFLVTQANKRQVLTELVAGGGRTLAFTRTRTFAERLARELSDSGVPALDLHGNLRQGARQRHLAAFADGSVSVLVATDIAARGIHVDDIGLVVHVDPPADPKAFLHRSGRTARAGAEGVVVTLATKNQNKAVRGLMAQVRITPVQTVVGPGHSLIDEVRAPRLDPTVRRGASIFEPDPDDVADEVRGRPEREGRQGGRPRSARLGREAGDRPARASGARAQRRGDERADQRRDERPARTTSSRAAKPWQERPARQGEGRTAPTGSRRNDARADAWAELDGRPAPFEERRGPARPAAATGERKPRWTAEDRRRAEARRTWRAEAGLPARGASQPARAKATKPAKPKPSKGGKRKRG